MHSVFRFLPVSACILSVMSFSGCATNAGGYSSSGEVEDRLMGMPKSELAMVLGAPTERAEISENSEVWTYRVHTEGLTGGQCDVSVTIKNDRVESSRIAARDRSPVAAPLGSCSSLIGSLD